MKSILLYNYNYIHIKTMLKSINLFLLCLFSTIHSVSAWCQRTKFSDYGPVIALDYSPDNTMILTITSTTLTIWKRQTKSIIFRRSLNNAYFGKFSRNSPSTYIGISSNSSMIQLISGVSPFGSIQTWDAGHGGGQAVYLDFTSNTVLLTCGGQTNKVKLWDISANPAVNTFMSSVAQMSVCGFSSPTRMGTATSNNKLYYNAIGGSITNLITISANSCKQIAFSPDGAYMIASCSSSSGTSAYFIQVATPVISSLVTVGNLLTAAYAGDGQTCSYGGNTNKLYVVNATGGNKTILSEFITNSNILASDFTDDGLHLLAGTADGTLYEYDKFCLDCLPGYFTNLTSKTCDLCEKTLKGCSNCNSSTVCIQCYQNFIYDAINFICLGCSGLMDGCGTCLTASTCRYCMVGYYMLANYTCAKCQSALTGCYSCNSSTYCYQCESDFYLESNNTCIACEISNPLCIKCVNTSYCTTCVVGYYQNLGVCYACPANCYICQSNTNCTDCLTGYYPLIAGISVTCTKCSTGCIACNATGYCRNCDDERYLSAGTCILCTYPCLTCNTSSYCLSCESAYFYNGAGGCTQCGSGCSSCNSSSICLSCSVGFYLEVINNTCMECQLKIPNCMECTNTTCTYCQLGFYLSGSTTCSRCNDVMVACAGCTSSTSCDFCASGYYKGTGTGNLSCLICVLGCATCIQANNCTSCNVGYYLDSAAATCNLCINNCVTCTNSTFCLQCQIGFSLGPGGTCISCSIGLSNCQSCVYNYTTLSLWCLSCIENTYIDNTAGTCVFCPINCTTCYNSISCESCQVGSYLDSNYLCKACHSNCSECTGSSSNCSACIAGYYVTSAYKCEHCSIFGCQTCNSTTHDCISCQIGFYLKTIVGSPSKICDNCLTAISNCYICVSLTVCKQCSYGYALATNQLSCSPCSAVEGCKHCISLSSCQNCQIGYYLSINGSGYGICTKCSTGCKQCDLSGVCLVCFSEYYFQNISGVISCSLCDVNIAGCLICTNSTKCASCLPGYYLNPTNTCSLCAVSLFACRYCNSSSVCTRCEDGYYLNSSNLCQKCETAIVGCQICNSSSVCLSCQFGMYLNSNLCYKCSVNLPNCLYCQNMTNCLQCDAGSYLDSVLLNCLDCEAHIPGCIQCSSANYCLQCKGGYYINSTTNLCSPCNQSGCEICLQTSPLSCVRCNSRFYMNATLGTCVKCRSQIDGCLECTSSAVCTQCDPGYFANSSSQCVLCESVMDGCGRCLSGSICSQCKSTYYLNSSFKCEECKLDLPGCSFCLNGTSCQSCYHGYYLTNLSTCESCVVLQGCLSCINSTYCQYCEKGYFLQTTDNTCYSCFVLTGCYACTDNITCSICMGGYILNDVQVCEVMKVQATERITDLKLVTKYVNSTCLVHYLYAKGMAYNQSNNIEWNKTTKLILQDEQYNQINLIILKVQWGTNNYTLVFYTDNPLKVSQTQFPMARRLLINNAITPKYKVNLKMNQVTINKILPQFYLPKDLIMDYDLNSPEFVMSYLSLNSQLLYYSIFGYVVTSILIIKYIIKASCSAPASHEMGDIIPQVLALKAPAFFLYPAYMEWIYYCAGFTLPDFPWLNKVFGNILADTSNKMPDAFSLFFSNLHIGSTYLLALIVIALVTFVLLLLYKNKQREYTQTFPIGNVFFNIFIFGATWASCASLQGGILNPIQSIDLNSGFYMIGIAFYCLICGICIYKTYKNWVNLSKIRIFTKATLLSLANISPIYIFFSSILADLILIIIQHNFIKNNRLYPRLWILKNILCNLALAVISIWTSALASLVITSAIITVAICIDFFTHIKQFNLSRDKRKLNLDNNLGNQSEIDVNIWNINFQKDGNTKIKEFQKEQDEMDKQGRKTAFDGTRATNFSLPKRKTNIETHKKLRRAKNEARPDIINIYDNKKVLKDQVQDLQNKEQLFIAKMNSK